MKAMRRLLFIVLCIIIGGCGAKQSQAGDKTEVIKDINSNEAEELINDNNVIIIDVRTPQEFANGHIKDARNINVADKNFSSRIDNLDKNDTYLIYCRTGSRSRYAVNMMEKLNFKTIYHLKNGISEWAKEGNPIRK